jgi:hypothetical protein
MSKVVCNNALGRTAYEHKQLIPAAVEVVTTEILPSLRAEISAKISVVPRKEGIWKITYTNVLI